jgi:hypothetical protein
VVAYTQWSTTGECYRKSEMLAALEIMLVAGNDTSSQVPTVTTRAVERMLEECIQCLGDE